MSVSEINADFDKALEGIENLKNDLVYAANYSPLNETKFEKNERIARASLARELLRKYFNES